LNAHVENSQTFDTMLSVTAIACSSFPKLDR